VSDYIGRTATYGTFFGLQIIAFLALPRTQDVLLFAGILFLIITAYGGGFACLPAYSGDLFGTKELGAIHGYTLTAWGLADIVGPTLVSKIVEITGTYEGSFTIVTGMLIIGLASVLFLRQIIRQIQESQDREGSAAHTD